MDTKMIDEKFEHRKGSTVEDGTTYGDGEMDEAVVKKALWKMDVRYVLVDFEALTPLLISIYRILPVLALLFLCSFIDRTNVGNAKILGLEKDIHITDHQYAIGLCVFYATYIASELPSNLVLKKVSPKIWLPGKLSIHPVL